jgi:fatty acid desaturase
MTIESNTAMSGPELRQFGLLFGAILVLLFGLLLPFLIGYSFPLWPWVVALIFAVLALLVMKLFGRDALARTTGGKNTDSYRVASAVRPNDHFERPY